METNKAKLSNLRMLQFVAHKLGDLCNEIVFVGGCTTAILITDKNILDVRFTMDVDCIVDVISRKAYYALERCLQAKGFKQSANESVICRWFFDDAVLDIMPTDEKILGFGNHWYKSAICNAMQYSLDDGNKINVISSPYFLATKLNAFRDRGNSDYLSSHDFEDIVTVIDGRPEVFEEVSRVDSGLKKFLGNEFSVILNDINFHDALPGHLVYYSSQANKRAEVIISRIENIIRNLK